MNAVLIAAVAVLGLALTALITSLLVRRAETRRHRERNPS